MKKQIQALAIGLTLSATPALAQVSDNVVRIDVLNDKTGIYADAGGKGSVVAAELAAQDFGGKVAGAPIEIVSADHQNKPDVASNFARQEYDTQGVDAIADWGGAPLLHSRWRMSRVSLRRLSSCPVPRRSKSPTSRAHYTRPTGFTTRTRSRPRPPERVLKAGGDSWFFITADYAFGQSMESEATKRVAAGGGKILGKVSGPLDTPDFSSFLLQAQGSGAKVLVIATAGSDTSNAIKEANEFKIIGGSTRVVTFLMLINDVHAIGLENGQGLTSSTTYYHDLDDGSRAFSKRFWNKIGRPPSIVQADVYSSVTHYLKAVEALKSDDSTKVAAQMMATPVNDAFTHNVKIRTDGRLLRDLYVTGVKKPSESKGPWDYWKIIATVPGDKAWRPVEESECSLLKKQ